MSAPTTTTTSTIHLPQSSEFEQTMLAEDKLFVVLAVVLVIWVGIVILLFRTDRKIDRLERRLADRSKEDATK